MSEKDYTAANEAVIRRWERDQAKREASAEASAEALKRTMTESLKQDRIRRGVVKDVKAAIEAGGQNSKAFRQAGEGSFRLEDDNEVITGFDFPWLKE